jgi:hypothetical protein
MGVQAGPYRIMCHLSYAQALLSYLAFPSMLDAL